MILVTGAAGFIGSCLVSYLNKNGYEKLILVDDFGHNHKQPNLKGKSFHSRINRKNFISLIRADQDFGLTYVFHLGARTDTTEKDEAIFDELNLNYSKSLWHYCVKRNIPLVYASSAATYGGGELGYNDDHSVVDNLSPLNPYGRSKNDFDKWVLKQEEMPPFWAGLKFFNVYGPNEYHKGRMASVIFHTFNQIKATGKMKLFRSHRPDIDHGHQSRDFIYVKDVVRICFEFMQIGDAPSGLFNVGTGQARTFLDLATLTFLALEIKPDIEFIDTPEDIRDTYQYYTKAEMAKLFGAGHSAKFYSLEAGIMDYVQNYLTEKRYY